MNGSSCMVAGLLMALLTAFLVFWYASAPSSHTRRRARRRCPSKFTEEDEEEDAWDGNAPLEPYVPQAAAAASKQDVLDFSEVLVTEDQRQETEKGQADAAQIQTINDRFQAAKRRVTENRLEVGVQNTQKRRKVIEQLLRRPNCSRRVRSWRTENSDYLRGDVRPKVRSGSTNLIRSAKNNPDIDLHPGALGPVAGMNGLWLSEENLPGNLVPDAYVEGGR